MRPSRVVSVRSTGVLLAALAMVVQGCCGDGGSATGIDPERGETVPAVRATADTVAGQEAGGADPARDRPLVFIDPGHGGAETGAAGVSGALEKDLVLAVALHTRQALEDTGLVDVLLSRDADVDVDLVRRPRMANAASADVFVSLHMNSAGSPRASGVETYYLNTATDEAADRLARRENLNVDDAPTDLEAILADLRLTGNVEASRGVADRVHRRLVDGQAEFYGDTVIRDRGLRTALFAVLVRAEMPAILVELCFLSNDDEERRARTRAYQEQAASAIAEGVIGFLRDQGRLPPPDPLAVP